MSARLTLTAREANRLDGWLPALFGALGLLLGAGTGLLVTGVSSSLLLLAIVLGIVALAATVARVEWGLVVLVFITYIRLSDVAVHSHGAPSVAKSLVLLLLFAVLVRWGLYREKPTGWGRPALLVGAYGLVGFGSLLYAADPLRAQEATLDFIKDAVIVVAVVILMQRGNTFRRVVWALLVAGIFMGSLSVLQYFTGTFQNDYWGFAQAPVLNIVGETDSPRASGPIGDPNFYAQVMLVLVPMALDRVWNERRRILKLLAAWALAASALAIVFSFSRGGFIALVVMLGASMVYRRQPLVNWLAAIALGLVLLRFVPQSYSDRIETLISVVPGFSEPMTTVREEPSFRGRASELIVAWKMFTDRPLVGVGLGNYAVHYQDYARQVGLAVHAEERAAHNLYLEIGAETGLLGLGAFAVVLWKAFQGLRQAMAQLAGAQLHGYAGMVSSFAFGLVGYLTAAIFIHAAYPRYFWLLAGIALAIPRVAAYEIAAKPRPSMQTAEA